MGKAVVKRTQTREGESDVAGTQIASQGHSTRRPYHWNNATTLRSEYFLPFTMMLKAITL